MRHHADNVTFLRQPDSDDRAAMRAWADRAVKDAAIETDKLMKAHARQIRSGRSLLLVNVARAPSPMPPLLSERRSCATPLYFVPRDVLLTALAAAFGGGFTLGLIAAGWPL